MWLCRIIFSLNIVAHISVIAYLLCRRIKFMSYLMMCYRISIWDLFYSRKIGCGKTFITIGLLRKREIYVNFDVHSWPFRKPNGRWRGSSETQHLLYGRCLGAERVAVRRVRAYITHTFTTLELLVYCGHRADWLETTLQCRRLVVRDVDFSPLIASFKINFSCD